MEFWKRMGDATARSGGKPPEFMSTHLSNTTSIENLKRLLPGALEENQRTR